MAKHPPTYPTFIRILREATGLDQGQFARAHNIHRSTLSSLENSKLRAGRKLRALMSRSLEVEPHTIFDDHGWPLVDYDFYENKI